MRRRAAVFDGEWLHREVAQSENLKVIEGLGKRANVIAGGIAKRPRIHSLERLEGVPGGVQGHRFFPVPTESADFVKSGNVIHMVMGVEHVVYLSELFAESLLAKVGTGIDEEAGLLALQVDRGPGASIARVG